MILLIFFGEIKKTKEFSNSENFFNSLDNCSFLSGKKPQNKNLSEKLTESDMNMIKKMINKLSTKEIIDILSQSTNVRKKEIYDYCLKLKNEK